MSEGVTLAELAEAIGAALDGDGALRVSGVATLERAGPGQLSFFHNARYRGPLRQTRAAAVILAPAERAACPVAALVHERPHLAYARAAALLHPVPPGTAGVHPSAVVAPGAALGEGVSIGPNSVVEEGARLAAGCEVGPGCVIGRGAELREGCRLVANVTLCHGVRLGRRVLVHPGAVIGADGFGLAQETDGRWIKVPQLGGVEIGDDVEIGANTTIDRGALEDTVLEEGVKLDNQIQIAHNVRVGAHTAMAGCVGVAGSAVIGKRCQIGGAAVVLGHLEIADDVVVTATSLVDRSINEPGTYSSSLPVMANRDWKRNAARLRHLDELAREVKRLAKRSSE
ncbi:UDP-3-O-(3-hydroxymyristoyl)glucosamine N-acyltransferase [Endothiovibrio diazotrophicus]